MPDEEPTTPSSPARRRQKASLDELVARTVMLERRVTLHDRYVKSASWALAVLLVVSVLWLVIAR